LIKKLKLFLCSVINFWVSLVWAHCWASMIFTLSQALCFFLLITSLFSLPSPSLLFSSLSFPFMVPRSDPFPSPLLLRRAPLTVSSHAGNPLFTVPWFSIWCSIFRFLSSFAWFSIIDFSSFFLLARHLIAGDMPCRLLGYFYFEFVNFNAFLFFICAVLNDVIETLFHFVVWQRNQNK